MLDSISSLRQVPDILVCGESLMDVFAEGDTPTGVSLAARMGGSPFNVAVGLARMAQSVAFLGAVSRDSLGERLMRALTAEGVDTKLLVRTDAPTTLSVVGVDPTGVPTYAFYGDEGADRQLPLHVIDRIPSSIQAIHVGSYAMLVEPIGHTLRSLVDVWRSSALVAWDPNVRLNVASDTWRWRDLAEWMLPRSHVVKVSEDDLAVLAPGATDESFATRALAAGVGLVVVTRGVGGASAWTRTEHARVAAVRVSVVDTVGAGDTFQAALLTGLKERGVLSADAVASLTGRMLQEVMELAARAAALTCARKGADLPRRGEVR